MARVSRRRRRAKPAAKALTLSATDAEWAVVRDNAARRGLSISRYAVALVLGGAWAAAEDEPALVLDAHTQREMFETVRSFRARMGDGAGAQSLIADLRTRVAVLFDAWAVSMVREGRREALGALLAARVGAESAAGVVGRIEALAAAAEAPPARKAPGDAGGPSGQGSLFP